MQSAPTPPAAPLDAATATLSRLVTTISEDMIFAIAGGDTSSAVLDGLAKRRAESYAAVLEQKILPTMTGSFDAWLAELVKAVAPVSPPVWLPMGEVIAEKVTLEVGARGLRSLFSSKPSEKDVQRVKRLGTLAVRALRATFAADGNIDAEEARTIGVLIGAFGLPHADAAPLYTEPVVAMDTLDVYGDIDAGVARALVRGAWHAAAWDAIDPREEQVIRKFAASSTSAPTRWRRRAPRRQHASRRGGSRGWRRSTPSGSSSRIACRGPASRSRPTSGC